MTPISFCRVFLIFMVVPTLAHCATVELKDGRIYSAEIISQDKERLILNINGAHVQFPRAMVATIDESAKAPAAPKNGEIKILPVTDGPAKVSGAAPITTVPASHVERTAPKGQEARLPPPEDPLILQRFHSAIDSLSRDAGIGEARRVLGDASDPGMAALAGYGIYHESPLVRTRSVDLLSEMGGRRVLKNLIETFHSAARPAPEAYQAPYMAALIRNISSLSGTEFRADPGVSEAVAAQMAGWWQQHYAKLPPQLGEAPLDTTATDYAARLAAARGLVLKKHEFAGSNPPVRVVTPIPPPAGQPDTVPPAVISRNLEQERATSTSQEPAVARPDTTSRDEPGLRRQQEYLEKIRDGTKKQ